MAVCRWTSHLPLRGSFSKRSTGHFHFPLYYICASLTPQRRLLLCCWQAAESNSERFAAVHLNGVCRWTSQLTWGVLFRKGQQVNGSNGSTGRRVSGSNGSTGQQVTFTFTILYMIADNARLTPPRCKKHTAYDDTRLTPHHCKKYTASFARSTGKFPSFSNLAWDSLSAISHTL